MTGTVILDGNRVAGNIKEKLAERIAVLGAKGVIPCLAAVLVGDDPSSATYVCPISSWPRSASLGSSAASG